MLDIFTESDEIDVFLCESLQEIIQFKWDCFGLKFHAIGFVMHAIFMLVLMIQIKWVYVEGYVHNYKYSIFLGLSILYPTMYVRFDLGLQKWLEGVFD